MKTYIKIKFKKNKKCNINNVITKTNLNNEDLAYVFLKLAYESVNFNEEILFELQNKIARETLIENE